MRPSDVATREPQTDEHCGFPSSVSDQVCILPAGHPADSGTRFHRFSASATRAVRDEITVLPIGGSRREALLALHEAAVVEVRAKARTDAEREIGALRNAQLDVDRLATALNQANIQPDEFRLGRDLRIPAARILTALRDFYGIETVVARDGTLRNALERLGRAASKPCTHHRREAK